MLIHLITLAALAVLYGLAWHDRPAREPVRSGPETRPSKSGRPNRS
jgi:hypothetical protein